MRTGCCGGVETWPGQCTITSNPHALVMLLGRGWSVCGLLLRGLHCRVLDLFLYLRGGATLHAPFLAARCLNAAPFAPKTDNLDYHRIANAPRHGNAERRSDNSPSTTGALALEREPKPESSEERRVGVGVHDLDSSLKCFRFNFQRSQ
eukprot:2383708-Rhodomonas_salina.1